MVECFHPSAVRWYCGQVAHTRPAVAIVGAGAVARALGRLMAEGGEPIVALASRSRSRAEDAARFIGRAATPIQVVGYSELPRLATRVLIAVSDQGIEPVAEALSAAGMRSGVALHTCGARGPDALAALRAAGVACGMLHPLQTIMSDEQGVGSFADVTFGLSGDREAIAWAGEIVEIVTGGRGQSLRIEADRLSYYHAGAVMASNALVAALDAAVILLAHAGVERDAALRAVGPLARASLDNALRSGPQAALTGPIVRGDAATVAAHRAALRDVDPTVATLYEAAARQLVQLAKQRGLSEASLRAVELVLDKRG
ncbi:MAG: DUF2520 domain-containing protein [Acidobacteria bacterium]|nr:DUF2520 domain-containing protein [Acidobacteriota bacterium]